MAKAKFPKNVIWGPHSPGNPLIAKRSRKIKKNSPDFFRRHPCLPDFSHCGGLEAPDQHPMIMVCQGQILRHRHLPPSGVTRNPGPCLDQPLDQPVEGPPHFLAPDIEPPDHVQKVIGRNPHLQPGGIGLETLAAGLVPALRVLTFLDPIFTIPPALPAIITLAALSVGTGLRALAIPMAFGGIIRAISSTPGSRKVCSPRPPTPPRG